MNWESSALWGIIGLIGGIIISFIFYSLSKKDKKLIYSQESQPLITNNISEIDGLQISYLNNPIKNLTTTTVTITSEGKANIQKEDFAQSDPLCLKTDGKFLLQNNVESILTDNSNDKNSIKLSNNSSDEIKIEFDYLSQKDFMTFTVFHTGSLSVNGTLKDGNILHDSSGKLDSFVTVLSTFVICILLVASLLIYTIVGQPENIIFNLIISPSLSIAIGMLITTFGLHLYRKSFNSKP